MKARKLSTIIGLSLGTLIMAFPFYWMAVTSVSTSAQASAAGSAKTFNWLPTDPQFENYPEALRKMGSKAWYGFLDALANTVVITTLCVVGQVLSCSLVGYAFARLRFRGNRVLFIVMLSTMMLPGQITMIPIFLLYRKLKKLEKRLLKMP